jgi:hypothetical protein
VGDLGGAKGGVDHYFTNVAVWLGSPASYLTYKVGANCPRGVGGGVTDTYIFFCFLC